MFKYCAKRLKIEERNKKMHQNNCLSSPLQIFKYEAINLDNFESDSRKILSVLLHVMNNLHLFPLYEIKDLHNLKDLPSSVDEIGVHICFKAILMIVDEIFRDVHEQFIHESIQYLNDSNAFLMYAYLFRYVYRKIPEERYLKTCLHYYQLSLAFDPRETIEDSDITESMETYLRECSPLQQVMTTTRPIHYPIQPIITPQVVELLYQNELESEINSNLHPEETFLLAKLKNNLKTESDVIDAVISVVKLYANKSLRLFILYQIMRMACFRKMKLDPNNALIIHLHILRIFNEIIDTTNSSVNSGATIQTLHFGNILSLCNINALDFQYYRVTVQSVQGITRRQNMERYGNSDILQPYIAKSIISNLVKMESLIPNIVKLAYYAMLSRVSCISNDTVMEEWYSKMAQQYRVEHDKEFPYALD